MDESAALVEFIGMLKQLTNTPNSDIPDIVVGNVVNGDPNNPEITIDMTGPSGEVSTFKLDKKYLIIGALCKEYWIPKHYIDEPPHKHEYHHGNTSPEMSAIKRIMIWRGLRPGDKVYMIKLRRGQLYYVAQRVEGCEAN